jgi:ankyrin
MPTLPRQLVIIAVLVLPTAARAQELSKELTQAINQNDPAAVKKLLDADPKLAKESTADGSTHLFNALRGNNAKVVELLILAGADPKAANSDGRTVLHAAAYNKHVKAAEMLIARGAEVNGRTMFDKFTPLHLAALGGADKVAEVLLANGANVEGLWTGKINDARITPLHLAAREGYTEVARLLLAKGANINAKGAGIGTTPLGEAAEHRRRDMVRLLLARGANPDAGSAFSQALQTGDSELVELFIAKGADATKPNLLMYAVLSGKKELVELLLDKGAKVDATERGNPTALWYAANWGKTDIVKLLLDRGADPKRTDDQGLTPLHAARNKEIAMLLLAKGADVNAAGKKGQTPLFAALRRGDLATAELLESKGAEHDAFSLAAMGRVEQLKKELNLQQTKSPADMEHLTPLHLAARFGQVKAAEVLLAKGADANAETTSGERPLHLAAAHGHAAMIELLIEHKAKVNAVTHGNDFGGKGQTALEMALEHGQVEAVQFLRKAGGLPKIDGTKDLARWLAIASMNRHFKLARALLDEGAPLDTKVLPEGAMLIHVAAEAGDLDLVKYLVAKGAIQAKGSHGKSVLVHAVEGDQLAVAEFLLANGARADGDGTYQPLHTAAFRGNTAIAKLLLDKGATLDQTSSLPGSTPLGDAARAGKVEVVKLLRQRGAELKKAEGAFHAAAFLGYKDVVEYLLDQGVGADTFLADGFYVYYFHFQPQRLSAVAFFAETDKTKQKGLNANITIREINGDEPFALVGGTPLQAAVAGERSDVAALLLKKGAKADARFPNGSTPLHLAVFQGDLATVKVLTDGGADVNARDRAGNTPLRLARARGEDDIAAFLESQKAKE